MKQVRTELRLPKQLKEAIEQLAKEDDRSLNNYVARVLANHVEKQNERS